MSENTFSHGAAQMVYYYYRVNALILVNIVPSCELKDASLRASVDIPMRDNIYQYQCNNPFCRTCVSTQVRYRRVVTRPFVRLSVRSLVNN